jgi:transcription-repair coupling factor (superfamily II helicase)
VRPSGTMGGLADLVLTNPTLQQAMLDARAGLPTLDLTGPASLRPFVVKGLADAGRTVLVVAATVREAEDLTEELADLISPQAVALYPAWETLPHERLSPRSDTVGRRLAVLRRLRHPGVSSGSTGATGGPESGPVQVVVAPVRSLLQPQVKGLADLEPVELHPGQEVEIDALVESLVGAAYSRVDLVERRGEFAVRGGIVDVFPPTEEHPLRVEFFGDEVEEIRSFAVADQRTMDRVERLWAPPCRELLLDKDVRRRAAELGARHPELREITDKLAEGIAVEGMESLTPALVDEMELLVDLLPADTHVVVLDPERVRTRAHDLVATSEEFLGASWAAAAGGGQAPIDLGAASLRELGEVRSQVLAQGQAWWAISPFGLDLDDDGIREVAALPAIAYRGDVEKAVADIRDHLVAGRRVVTVHQGHGPAQRMVEVLSEHDVPARLLQATDAADEG